MDDDMRGARAFHDFARPGAFLWRPGSRKERPFRTSAMPGHRRAGHDRLVGGRIFARIFAQLSVYRWIKVRVSARSRCEAELGLFLLGFAGCLRDVSTDVRDHHTGVDHWCCRRANEICGRARFRRRMAISRSHIWCGESTVG